MDYVLTVHGIDDFQNLQHDTCCLILSQSSFSSLAQHDIPQVVALLLVVLVNQVDVVGVSEVKQQLGHEGMLKLLHDLFLLF